MKCKIYPSKIDNSFLIPSLRHFFGASLSFRIARVTCKRRIENLLAGGQSPRKALASNSHLTRHPFGFRLPSNLHHRVLVEWFPASTQTRNLILHAWSRASDLSYA
jgi:hypothetical protein